MIAAFGRRKAWRETATAAAIGVSLLRGTSSLSFVDRVRLAETIKKDDDACFAAIEKGRFALFYRGRALIGRDHLGAPSAVWVTYEDTHHVHSVLRRQLFLMNDSALLDVEANGIAHFALQLSPNLDEDEVSYLKKEFLGKFEDMRTVIVSIHSRDGCLLAKGSSLLTWHGQTRFCASCGAMNMRNFSGSQRVCTTCQTLQYPKISPVAIVVVSYNDKILLVRQPRHPRGLYTAIAGFAEMGESIEETIHREVAEEVGLEIENVVYVGSQCWPIPSASLMIGCLATSKSGQEVQLDKRELEEYIWLNREQVTNALNLVKDNPQILFSNHSHQLLIPPPGPIAHDLIAAWLQNSS